LIVLTLVDTTDRFIGFVSLPEEKTKQIKKLVKKLGYRIYGKPFDAYGLENKKILENRK